MNFFKAIMLIALSWPLFACSSPYFEGKSPADVPGHVNVIRLQSVEMLDGWTGTRKSELPEAVHDISTNDQEVLDLTKRVVINQLTNFGYEVTEKQEQKSDIVYKVFVDYIPEYGIINRVMKAAIYVLNPEGDPLFLEMAIQANSMGFIGALFESRDDVVAAIATKVAIETVNEMRKGTKENTPVETK